MSVTYWHLGSVVDCEKKTKRVNEGSSGWSILLSLKVQMKGLKLKQNQKKQRWITLLHSCLLLVYLWHLSGLEKNNTLKGSLHSDSYGSNKRLQQCQCLYVTVKFKLRNLLHTVTAFFCVSLWQPCGRAVALWDGLTPIFFVLLGLNPLWGWDFLGVELQL